MTNQLVFKFDEQEFVLICRKKIISQKIFRLTNCF